MFVHDRSCITVIVESGILYGPSTVVWNVVQQQPSA